ncbi:MAG: hypothetical protein R3B70_39680 [Polyangiaceae bacterium]
MRALFCSALGLLALAASTGCTPPETAETDPEGGDVAVDAWAMSFPQATGTALSTGPDGDLVVGGGFNDSINLGGGFLTAEKGTAVFIAHLNSAGEHLMSGATGSNDSVTATAIDGAGAFYVTGTYDGAINFGSGKLTGYKNGYLAAFEPDGDSAFSAVLGGMADDASDDVAVTPTGNVIVAVRAGDDADFGGGPASPTYTAKQGVVVAYSPAGKFLWELRMTYAIGQPLSVGSDAAGNIYVCGLSYGDLQVGDLTTTPGSFIAKLSPGGKPLWVRSTDYSGASTLPSFGDLSVAPNGTVYVTGSYYYGSFKIGGVTAPSALDPTTFFLGLSPDGDTTVLKTFDTPSYYGPPQLAVTDKGELLIGLNTYYAVDLGGGVLSLGPQQNILLGRFSADGTHLKSTEIPGDSGEWLTDLAAIGDQVVMLGGYATSITLAGEKLTTESGASMFLARVDF